jgi:predicted nuclease of predicted toxin-antitoxin system
MKFLADENVDMRLVKWLEGTGYDVQLASKGIKNSKLFELAKKLNRILLTNDTDFLNTLLYSPKKIPGIIVFRILKPTLEKQKKSLLKLLPRLQKGLKNKIIELFENSFNIYSK